MTTEAPAAEPIRVLLVDDQALIRTGFAMILESAAATADYPPIEIAGEAGTGNEALALLRELAAGEKLPHVVLMDVRMPDMDGITATREVLASYPAVRVLVLTTFDIDEYAVDAVAAGASGFLLKDVRAPELVRAVRAVWAGDQVLAQSVTWRLMDRLRKPVDASPGDPAKLLPELTEREREVFMLMADGLTNAEIGERLFLSESTIKTHAGRVLQKLGLADRVHAVIHAYDLGLKTPCASKPSGNV